MMSTSILSVRNLTTKLQIGKNTYPVVENLHFDLYPGKTLAVVGETGCGKSLTALSIMRILPTPPALPSTGEILYKGRNLLTLSEREMRKIRGSKIAMIFQNPGSALNPVYTIGDQMLEVVQLHLNLYGDEALERIVRVLQEAGISSPMDRLNDYPHQLSGGMKQRVMIAMALICEPDILIADEPTTALDVTIQAQVLDLIKDLQKKKGMAVLVITHDMGVVAEIADDVIVMYASQGVERGSVDQIFNHMSHPYTQGLFKSRTSNQPRRARLMSIQGSVPSIINYPSGCRFHPRCPYVMEKCCQGDVPTMEIERQHTALCWLYDGTEESKEKKAQIDLHHSFQSIKSHES
ncbi:MAG: peptide ABC transporter ATP-binding protein [Chlamydiales bacterium 38-26]|nr:ABC transporter ATP-binding protein [Chlamydiales bacterium]OJV08250.1 MAG: peptide ABC transporter ATP-binding protein [Chlamydiales bacterium 38-26]